MTVYSTTPSSIETECSGRETEIELWETQRQTKYGIGRLMTFCMNRTVCQRRLNQISLAAPFGAIVPDFASAEEPDSYTPSNAVDKDQESSPAAMAILRRGFARLEDSIVRRA